MKIETIDISALNPAHYNPRKDLSPQDPEYQKLKKSILEFEYIDPLIVNKRGFVIIGGHQRYKILKELGYKNIECSMVDLPDEKEKALNIALNKHSGEWDYPKLKDLIVEIDTGDFDIEVTGFDQDELEDMFSFYGKDILSDQDESYFEQVKIKLTIKTEIWADSKEKIKKILNGLCEMYAIEIELPNEKKKQKKQRF